MKKQVYWILSALILVSMLLSACGEAATTEAPQPVATTAPEAQVEPEVEQPAETEVPVEVEVFDPAVIDQAFSLMLSSMTGYNTATADSLMEGMLSDTPPFLLDVRTVEEVETNGHIEGAVNIALDQLAQNLNVLPAFDTPIVVYCGSGWRATTAMTALHGLGWTDVRALKVAFADWVAAGNPVVAGLPEPSMASNDAVFAPEWIMAFDGMLQVYGVKPYGGISAADLNLALGENPDLIVMDVRTAAEVEEKGQIDAPNWVHIPLEELLAQKAQWPAADASIAIYCGSGHRSTMALAILGVNGYNNLTSMQGGFGAWLEAGFPILGGTAPVDTGADLDAAFDTMLATMISYNTLQADVLMTEMIEDTPPFLLDVRTTEEVETNGHIEGATHIPLAELAQHIDLLPAFDASIVAYCGSGWRATLAMTALHGMGWTDVRALKTSFADWVAAGNPVVAGLPENMALNAVEVSADLAAAFDAALSIYGVAPYALIDSEGFNTALVEDPDLIVIDVRTAEELAAGVVDSGEATFIHIALQDMIDNKAEWPAKDARIMVYCGSGHRSTMAAMILGVNGYTNVSSLKGGFGDWVAAGYPVAEYALP